MRIGLTIPSDTVSPRTLNAAAEANTEVCQAQIEAGKVPPLGKAIEQGLVEWSPEANPPGQESFDIPQTVLKRGTGDCDDLAPWWAAELRASHVDPDASAEVYQSGPSRFHVVVRRGDGTVDDPSQWAGMGKRVSGVRVPARKPLGRSSMVVGFTPLRGDLVRARLDVPIDGQVCGVHVERVGIGTVEALERVCRTAGILAFWGAPSEVLARMAACASAISQVPYEELSGEQWEEVVGAVTASIDPTAASNIAMSLFDPFGLRNLIAPAAQSFLQSYTQQQQQPASPPGKARVTVQPQTSGAGRSSRGSSRGGSRGSRGSSQQSQQSQDPYVDPATGATYDPSTGNWYDAATGLQLDPATGQPLLYEQSYSQAAYPSVPTPYYGSPYGGGALPGDPYQGAASMYSPYAQGPYSQFGYGLPYGYQPQQYSYTHPLGY